MGAHWRYEALIEMVGMTEKRIDKRLEELMEKHENHKYIYTTPAAARAAVRELREQIKQDFNDLFDEASALW